MPHPANGKRYPPEPLTCQEVYGLIRACRGTGPLAHRNRALIALLWRSGVRISEALSLRPSDVDYREGTVRVRTGKGKKDRVAVIDAEALGYLRAWLEVRRRHGINGRAPLFCTVADGSTAGCPHARPASAVAPEHRRYAVVIVFFFLKDGDRMWGWLLGLVPRRRRNDVRESGERAWAALGAFLRGQTVVALFDATAIGLGLIIVGVPLALPLAVLVFVATMPLTSGRSSRGRPPFSWRS